MKFLCRMQVTAVVQYEVMVDAQSTASAEMEAIRNFQKDLPADFKVDGHYFTGVKAESVAQRSWECPECGKPTDGPALCRNCFDKTHVGTEDWPR